MSIKIYPNAPDLWQWDRGRKLLVDDADCNQVHFYNGVTPGTLAKDVYVQDGKRVADVPDILLQVARNLTVYTYKKDETSALTINATVFNVNPRRKPDDYIYTEDEIHTWEELEKRVKALEETGELPDEAIAEAVKAYLEENHIETGATAEEAAQIEKNKEDIQNLSNDKLDADKLPEAVNEALAQAKASGEFDGKDGKDGEPGPQGEKGDPGEPGRPGEKGDDYVLTDADKSEIAQLAVDLLPRYNGEVENA